MRGNHKGHKGKIIQVFRKKWVIHIDKLTKNKANGAPYQIPIDPSKVAITKVKEGKDRLARITKVAAGVAARKGKAEKKVRTTNWFCSLFNISILKSSFIDYILIFEHLNYKHWFITYSIIKLLNLNGRSGIRLPCVRHRMDLTFGVVTFKQSVL